MAIAPLTPEEFALATGVSRETLDVFRRYEDLLIKWQGAVNLVGKGTLDNIWRRHFLDSAQLLPLIPDAADGKPVTVLDVGSGAGFPGLVLAIMSASGLGPRAGLRVHLVEANGRKCVFLAEVARVTGTDVKIHNERVENLTAFPVDIVTTRAFAPIPRLFASLGGFLSQPRKPCFLALKGRTAERELTAARKEWKMNNRQSKGWCRQDDNRD
jgi:16S rRNA (guanine527-N7)-methyltransferase